MSGHSKWATTKRQKAATDAKRGAIFTKLANVITVAAREKGGDPEMNFSLRMAIDKAKTANMPKENIERAIRRGTGEGGGAEITEAVYEGIGPANTQFIVRSLTDNKNRSAANVRHIFTKYGGSFGSVAWNFEKKGVIRVAGAENFTDELELGLIGAGAQDIIKEEEGITAYTNTEDLQKAKNFLEERNIATETAEIEFVAKTGQALSGEEKEKVQSFIDELDECEDVADYYTNADI